MENRFKFYFPFFVCTLITVSSCESQQKRFSSPPGYDLARPNIYKMPGELNEISGIAFPRGNSDTLYAEQDESGKVFHFKLGSDRIKVTKFWRNGDFEDISICNNYIVMLRSDGVLFSFPISETVHAEAGKVRVFENILSAGEYEGLACSENTGKIYVLCKHCANEKSKKWGGGSILQLDTSGNLVLTGEFEIEIKSIDVKTGAHKIIFHPSALAENPLTKDWYVLSSVNKLLVITDAQWKVKSVYPLDPAVFNQPEGIAFDRQQNLYISNERGESMAATVLLFPYKLNK
jgi:uncharacterized protein YjiK